MENENVSRNGNFFLSIIYIFIIAFLAFIITKFLFANIYQNEQNKNEISKIIIKLDNNNEEKKNGNKIILNANDVLKKYDKQAIYNILVPPKRRGDHDLPIIPEYTQRVPTYKKVGMLINNDIENGEKYKMLLLMGRQTHIGSNVYEYYAIDSDKNSLVKFEIPNSREIQTGDIVTIPLLNKQYSANIDNLIGYKYNPYDINLFHYF